MPPLSVVAGYVLIVLLWGSTWAAIKVGVTHVPPFVFAFERAVAVTILMTALCFALRLPFPRDRRTVAAAAFAGIINSGTSWAIIFWSEQFVPTGLVSVFGAAFPIWTAFLAHFFVRGDRLSMVKTAGLACGLLGIGVLVGTPELTARPETFLATILLALMPISWAFGTIVQVRVLREGSPLPIVAIGMAAGAAVLAPFALTQAGQPATWTPEVFLAFGYLVVFGSGVGLVLQLWLTRRLRPTTMTLSQLLMSVEAILIGSLVLGESLTWRMLAGAALVGLAVGLNAIAGGGARSRATAAPVPGD